MSTRAHANAACHSAAGVGVAAACLLVPARAALAQGAIGVFAPQTPTAEEVWADGMWWWASRLFLLALILLLALLVWRRWRREQRLRRGGDAGGGAGAARVWSWSWGTLVYIVPGAALAAAAGIVLSVPTVYGVAGGPGQPGWTVVEALLWTIGGGITVAAAALLLLAAIGDPSRRRRRCPRCWYDMVGAPSLTCPECGKAAKREASLFRTRRRRWWVASALVMMVAGMAVFATPSVRSGRWPRYVPNTVLIVALPELDWVSPRLWSELNTRLFGQGPEEGANWHAQLSEWQRRLLARRSAAALTSEPKGLAFDLGIKGLYCSGEHAAPYAERLFALLANSAPDTRASAAGVLRMIPSVTDRLIPALAAAMEQSDDNTAASLLSSLMSILDREPGRADARALLLANTSPGVRPLTRGSAFRLLRRLPPTEDVLSLLHRTIAETDPADAYVWASAASSLIDLRPDDPRTGEAILAALHRSIGTELAPYFARLVAQRWPEMPGAVEAVAAAYEGQPMSDADFAVQWWFVRAERPVPVSAALVERLLAFPHMRPSVLKSVHELGEGGTGEAAGLVPMLERLLDASDDPGERRRIIEAIDALRPRGVDTAPAGEGE